MLRSRTDVDAQPADFSVDGLRRFGSRPALVAGERIVSYLELAESVDHRRLELGSARRLVALRGSRDLEFVVTMLAALAGRHPVAIVDGEVGLRSLDRFDPDVVVRTTGDGASIEQLDRVGERILHPDLAMLLSTSGSTGSSKLVRLAAHAVATNAAAIASYLELTTDDVGITSLPLQYCYGLSVVTSHLAVGASVVLSDSSVVDPCFAVAVERHGVTGFAGVPHTFEMLDRGDEALLASPSLRYITQAGGRLDPDHVRRLALAGQRHDVELFVMYGQTEATARMAYLPPSEALDAPESVGRAIPGGTLSLSGVDERGVGEVVFRGPNVMMGYATESEHLADGHDADQLQTGDLGRFDEAGRLHIVGRSSRMLKIHGKRLDLDHLERELALVGPPVRCAGDDDGLVVAVVDDTAEDGVAAFVADLSLARVASEMASIPLGRVDAVRVPEMPRTTSGKLDAPALVEGARATRQDDDDVGASGETVTDVYSFIFGGRQIDPTASFASMGGDSFSFVELSIRLEAVLGRLPSGWHLMSVADLEQLRPADGPRRRWTTQVDTSVVVRAIAILLIVCTHMKIFRLAGGAHALLAVVGWNFARFQLSAADVPGRFRKSIATVARIAIPTSVWVGLNMIVAGGYGVAALFLANNYLGDAERRDGRWEYWYFETFVQVSIVLAALFAIPAVRRAERRGPFLFAAGVLGLTWLFRFDVLQWGGSYNEVFRPHTVASFIALGWCAQRAVAVWQKVAVTAATVVTTFGYFETVGYVDQFDREARVALIIVALIWIPSVRLPRLIAPVVATIAAASMWIFLVHWQVWPALTPVMDDDLAFWLTIASGVVVWWVAERVQRWFAQRRAIGRSTRSHVSTADTEIKVSDATPVSA